MARTFAAISGPLGASHDPANQVEPVLIDGGNVKLHLTLTEAMSLAEDLQLAVEQVKQVHARGRAARIAAGSDRSVTSLNSALARADRTARA